MAIALLTTYLAGYRMPLYQRLAERHGVEVLCYGRGERYVPEWFRDLDTQLEAAPFPARRLRGARQAFRTQHGLGEGQLAIYVGGLVPEKGVEVLLDTWPSINARCGATLVLVGDGPLASKAGRTEAAKLIGPLPRPELPAGYAAADV